MTNGHLGPNEYLIGKPGSRWMLNTPNLVLDVEILERNIRLLAERAKSVGIHVRPHGKAHKSPDIARLQMDAGAIGICCATIREAEEIAGAGIPGCLITSPPAGSAKVQRVAALHSRVHDLMVVADNAENVTALGRAVKERGHGKTMGVLVDLDVGMHRTGVADKAAAVQLARLIKRTEGLRYEGIQAYSGRDQHVATYDERRRTYGEKMRALRETIDDLRAAELAPRIITGGGTGTFGLDLENKIFTELQPGSYVFMDVEYGAVELRPGEAAFATYAASMFVQTTVVSVNAVAAEKWVVTDGGYKSFATDGPMPQPSKGVPAGSTYKFFGDEHGRVTLTNPEQHPKLGDIIECISPHCDPTVNLHSFYHCVKGDQLVAIWPIPARGSL